MTETNGWPGQPGGPLNPEKDGWHWCLSPLGDDLFPCFWRAAGEASNLKWPGKWPGKWLYRRNDWNPKECTYLGPVLTPDEAAALQARADQAALGHAREADRADQSEFLHKQEIAELQKRVAKLKGALREMIYETTHLSPQEDDGSHWCKISKRALEKARAALEEKSDLPTMTEEQLREMMRDPRYWRQRNPEWVKRVIDGFRALAGGKDE
jgi:hypothetical protein